MSIISLTAATQQLTATKTAARHSFTLSAGDAATLFKEAQQNLFFRDDRPRPTVLPEEMYQKRLVQTCADYIRSTDWAMNALLYTVQSVLHIAAHEFPGQEPTVEILKDTLGNQNRFSPCSHVERMASSCMTIYKGLQEYGLSKEDIANENTVLAIKPRDPLETVRRFRDGDLYVQPAWDAYVFERYGPDAFIPSRS